MNVITIDFETYYAKGFGFSKLTTEEYINDERFEVIGVAVKVNDGNTEWFTGTYEETKTYLRKFDFSNSILLAHNTIFDGAILSWKFGIKAKKYADTLCMARAINGVNAGGSLAYLSELYNLGKKGDEVVHAEGKRRTDFKVDEMARYGAYCKNDVELTYKLFNLLAQGFSIQELRLIDLTLKMYIDPVLQVDVELLQAQLAKIVKKKKELLEYQTML